MPDTHPIAGRSDSELRATLVAMGEDRVRHLLKQQMMVHHLIVPAHEWLTELDAAREKDNASHAEG